MERQCVQVFWSLSSASIWDSCEASLGVTMWPLLGPDLPNQKGELIDNGIVDGRCEIYEADQAATDV